LHDLSAVPGRAGRVVVLAEASPDDPAAVGGVSGYLRAVMAAAPENWVLLAPSPDRTDAPGTLGPSLYLRRFPHRIAFPARLLRRLGALTGLRPAAVYTHSNEAAMLLCLLRNLGMLRFRLVHHQHGSENPLAYATFPFARRLGLPSLYNVALRLAHRCVDHLVVIDAKCLEMNRKWGVPEERMTLLPNAVDIEAFRPCGDSRKDFRNTLSIPGDAFLFCFAGRLEEVKRVHLAIRAMEHVRGQPWLAVAGEGTLRGELEAMARASSASGRILFCGPLDPDGMRRLYSASDCLVLPSAAEGVPLVILEAMAAGIPTLATAVGGIPGLLGPGRGIVVDAGVTPEELARAMEAAAGTPWDRDRIRSAAEQYSAGRALDVLKRLLT
jgi:glycosyltransferase involved in cell wall biosynthesis